MTIDGTDIKTTYGLRLSRFEDYYNNPARKQILEEQKFTANDIVFKAKTAKITLIGKYADTATMITAVKAFETALKSVLNHAFNVTEHSESFNGTCKDGYKAETWLKKSLARITLEITINE